MAGVGRRKGQWVGFGVKKQLLGPPPPPAAAVAAAAVVQPAVVMMMTAVMIVMLMMTAVAVRQRLGIRGCLSGSCGKLLASHGDHMQICT
jgi:hypothetical protein